MSQNNENENNGNEEENKDSNNAENIDDQQANRTQKRRGTGVFVKKIINDPQNKNGVVYKEPPKQLENNTVESEEVQSYPSILRFSNDGKNNGADRFNNKNSYIHSMRNLYKDSKNEGLFSKKDNNGEAQNNGNNKFEQKYSIIGNMKNPYLDDKNDETNNEAENIECQNVEKEVFNSQISMQSNDDEQTINKMSVNPLFYGQNDNNVEDNNYRLNFNSSSIVMQGNNEYNNEYNNEGNNNNCNLSEIKKNDNNDNNANNNNANKRQIYNLPSSINANINISNSSINKDSYSDNPYKKDNSINNNSINIQANNDGNNNNSYVINNPSIYIEASQITNSNIMTSQNSSNEQVNNYSQLNLNYNPRRDVTKIGNGSYAPLSPEDDKSTISQNEIKAIKIDNHINSNNPSNPNNPSNSNNQVSKHLLDRYKKVSKTGLSNLGDSSYLNAVLQSLGHVRYFASYFLNPKNQEFINSTLISKPLAFVTQRLFTHLYPYPESNTIEIYSPDSYLEILSFLKSPYGKQRSNPNDLLIFILNTLHYELNSKKNNDQIIRMPYDYYFSANNVIQNGINNFTNNNKSKISDVVSWFQLSESKCTNCGISTFGFNSFHTFDLDIKNAYKYFSKNGKDCINIYDCLFYGSMPKQSKSYCYNCKNRVKNYKQSRIYSSPNVFIFLLDRGIDFDENTFHIPFKVEDKINLRGFIIKENIPVQYELTGIVSFNLQEQKYISYCQSPIDSNWYLYNDEKVNLVLYEDILKNKNGNDIPCILYYKSI